MSQNAPAGGPRKSEPLSKRSYTLKLTFSTLMTASIVLIISIGWSFVLGVMVGRGYNPEKKVPQLATLLPHEDGKGGKGPRESLGDSLPKAEVMKPEDLRYSSTLKGKPGQPSTEPKPRSMQNATAQASVDMSPVPQPAAPPAAGSTLNLGAVEQNKPRQDKAQAQQPMQPQAQQQNQPSPTEARFDFMFQVATFKDENSVDKLRAKLEGLGLRTRLDKDGKLLKVMVLMRGTNEQGQELRQQMVDMGLGQPLQRAKKPVPAQKKR